ncbi:hypothetical protein P7C70_g1746, partial [Phenoliferia sp. Uapishka_3]
MDKDVEEAELPESFHPSTCTKLGLLKTASKHQLFYEHHASPVRSADGSVTHCLLVCGMYSTASSALHTLRHLTSHPGFEVVVMDNRGVGLSDAPTGRYRTSDMAQDVVALLDHLKWKGRRMVHVIGVSLGGMVAQELVLAVPERIASLVLTSTRAGPIPEWPSYKVGGMLARQITRTVRGPAHAAALAVDCLFPSFWLDQPDDLMEGSSRREVLETQYILKAQGPQPSVAGKLGQFFAVTSHYVSPHKLATILATIPRVEIIVGDHDVIDEAKAKIALLSAEKATQFETEDGASKEKSDPVVTVVEAKRQGHGTIDYDP